MALCCGFDEGCIGIGIGIGTGIGSGSGIGIGSGSGIGIGIGFALLALALALLALHLHFTFASVFWPQSMSPTLAKNHWGIHGGAAQDNCSAPDVTNSFWKDCTGTNVMVSAECQMLKVPNAECTNTQMHKCINARMHKCTNAQMPNAQMPNAQMLRMHKCTNAQMHKCTNAQMPNAQIPNETCSKCQVLNAQVLDRKWHQTIDLSNPKLPLPPTSHIPQAERNYPCDNLILGYFGNTKATAHSLDEIGEEAFKRQLYQCMVAQALAMSSDIETRRSINTFGIVTWQLNEIWPTGGWGSLEYGTVGYVLECVH